MQRYSVYNITIYIKSWENHRISIIRKYIIDTNNSSTYGWMTFIHLPAKTSIILQKYRCNRDAANEKYIIKLLTITSTTPQRELVRKEWNHTCRLEGLWLSRHIPFPETSGYAAIGCYSVTGHSANVCFSHMTKLCDALFPNQFPLLVNKIFTCILDNISRPKLLEKKQKKTGSMDWMKLWCRGLQT